MAAPGEAAKACACTGIRWCRRCLDPALRERFRMDPPARLPRFLEDPDAVLDGPAAPPFVFGFDPRTSRAPGCPGFEGVHVIPDFVSEAAARKLLATIDRTPMTPSQSGKCKQHYGPRFNFNKRRLKADRFAGLPAWAFALERAARQRVEDDERLSAADRLALEKSFDRYTTTDAFVLRYDERESSNLDFHVDDVHAYGELILGLSLDSDCVLTFLEGGPEQTPGRPEGDFSVATDADANGRGQAIRCVRVALPARSLMLLHGPARLGWHHAILARDVRGVRTSITLRTLAPALRESETGQAVMRLARP